MADYVSVNQNAGKSEKSPIGDETKQLGARSARADRVDASTKTSSQTLASLARQIGVQAARDYRNRLDSGLGRARFARISVE